MNYAVMFLDTLEIHACETRSAQQAIASDAVPRPYLMLRKQSREFALRGRPEREVWQVQNVNYRD